MDTYDTILPVVQRIYGAGDWTEALTRELARRLDLMDWDSRGREYMVMMICWDWMTGGSTADYASKEILTALDARREDDRFRDSEHRDESLEEDDGVDG
jgi:hypothetical protein